MQGLAFKHNQQVVSGQVQFFPRLMLPCVHFRLCLASLLFFSLQPDEYCYKAAIIACSAANQWGSALDLFRRFQRATDGTGGASPRAAGAAGDKGGVPGTAIYNAVITACGRGLFTEEALAFFLEMGERGVPRDEVRAAAAATFGGSVASLDSRILVARELLLLVELP